MDWISKIFRGGGVRRSQPRSDFFLDPRLYNTGLIPCENIGSLLPETEQITQNALAKILRRKLLFSKDPIFSCMGV